MKKSRKGKAQRERKAAFKTWLILNDVTQKELAKELGLCVSAISMMIERGKFTDGVFAEWWKKNIEKANAASYAVQSTKKEVVA